MKKTLTDRDTLHPFSAEENRRIEMTASCADCQLIPKVPGAGEVFGSPDGRYQLMHCGIKVVEGGYYGAWMTELIKRLHGHHEPQEEKAFHEILKSIPENAVMIELGSYWSYYSLWFQKQIVNARNFLIEPDPNNLGVGKKNFDLNGMKGFFFNAAIGKESKDSIPFQCESDHIIRRIPIVSIDDFVEREKIETVELLLSDIQGFELEMLQGATKCLEQGRIRFMVISTHHHSISHDPLTHQKCLDFVRQCGGHVLVEHNITESYGGDGMIVASFRPEDHNLPKIEISRNYPANSLFREPGYDLSDPLIEMKQNVSEVEQLGSTQETINAEQDLALPQMKFISYAQNYEDVMLYRALKNVEKGVYIDVGANDPIVDSVTKAFYERGWRGINIEPIRHWYDLLAADRPEDINLNIAISDESGTLRLYDVKETGLATSIKEFADRHELEHGFQIQELIVPAMPLEAVLKTAPFQEIHFLKIDVEGAEKQVLAGINLKHNRPWIILLEATKPNSQEQDYENWEFLLTDADYQFVYFDGLNRFYVPKEREYLASAFSIPPNYFDNFVSDDEWNAQTKLMTAEFKAHRLEIVSAERDHIQAERDHFSEDLNNVIDDRKQIQKHLDEVWVNREQIRKQFYEAEADRERTQKQFNEVQADRERTQKQLDEVLADRERILHTSSWKVTAPLRAVLITARTWINKLIHLKNKFVLGIKQVVKLFIRGFVVLMAGILRLVAPGIYTRLSGSEKLHHIYLRIFRLGMPMTDVSISQGNNILPTALEADFRRHLQLAVHEWRLGERVDD